MIARKPNTSALPLPALAIAASLELCLAWLDWWDVQLSQIESIAQPHEGGLKAVRAAIAKATGAQ